MHLPFHMDIRRHDFVLKLQVMQYYACSNAPFVCWLVLKSICFDWKIGGELWPRLTGATKPRPTGAKPCHQGSCPSIFGKEWLGLQDELSIRAVECKRVVIWCIMDSEVMHTCTSLHEYFKLLRCHMEFHFSLSRVICWCPRGWLIYCFMYSFVVVCHGF